jgi:hypothetical protein
VYCQSCGIQLSDSAKFCSGCGAFLAAARAINVAQPIQHDPLEYPQKIEDVSAVAADDEEVLLTWQTKIRVATDKTIWKQLLLCFGIGGGFVVALFNIIMIANGDWQIKAFLWSFGPVAAIVGVLLLLAVPSTLIVGFYEPAYTLTTKGIICTFAEEALKTSRQRISALKAIGIATGNLTTTASAFLAEAKLRSDMLWINVVNVAYRKDKNMIIIQQKGITPDHCIWLYCGSHFDEVKAIIKNYAPNAGDKVPKIWQ